MKKNQFCLYTITITILVFLITGCHESNPEKDNIFQRLKTSARINTFSLSIITSDRLNDDIFPEDLRNLCALSKTPGCKTLPDAGILRLGPNIFHTYNCISELKIPDSIENNEAAITDMVDQKVAVYYSTTKLKDYDSLLTVNRREWNVRSLLLSYIDNATTDSIFFFSNTSGAPSAIQAGNKTYAVYNNSGELRKAINALVCKGTGAISVFYNAPSLDSLAFTSSKATLPKKDSYAGDTCVGYSKYQKLNDGNGGFKIGTLVEKNSAGCQFVFPTGVGGDTCIDHSKYQKLHNGKGGFKVGSLIEKNSAACGFAFPTKGARAGGIITNNGIKYEKLHNGKGGFMPGNVIAENKPVKKIIPVPDVPVTRKPETATKRPVREISTNKKDSNIPKPAVSDKRCVRKSDPLCEKDSGGNYTGRRVQYCYNKSGSIIQTIVLSKCDVDCHCF